YLLADHTFLEFLSYINLTTIYVINNTPFNQTVYLGCGIYLSTCNVEQALRQKFKSGDNANLRNPKYEHPFKQS
ncbi:hypothetical protein MCHI_003614, partial [Candidatus Magnetoovum chiemensis]